MSAHGSALPVSSTSTYERLDRFALALLVQAGLSLSMCTVAWMRKAVPEKTKAAIMGACTTLITAFACLTIFVVTETALDIRQVTDGAGYSMSLSL